MNVIFLSTLYPENHDEFYTMSKIAPQYSAHKYCSLFVDGIENNLQSPVHLINLPPVFEYPFRHKASSIPEFIWKRNNESQDISIGFCNIFGLREISRKRALTKQVLDRLGRSSENTCVIAYSMSAVLLHALAEAKKNFPSVKTCLIVPDLPQLMRADPTKIYKFLKGVEIREQYRLLPYVDSYVLIAEQMREYLPVENKPWIVIESMVEVPKDDVQTEPQGMRAKEKVILYSGTLAESYGFSTLLSVFEKISNPDFRLWVIGDGGARERVIRASQADSRIQYMGTMPNKEVIKLQKKATLLVNPRPVWHPTANYAFPGKTTEYMLSGTPSIMFRLGGITDDYSPYIYYFESEDPQIMARQMIDVCRKSPEELNAFGLAAKNFVVSNKNCTSQTRNMLAMLEGMF